MGRAGRRAEIVAVEGSTAQPSAVQRAALLARTLHPRIRGAQPFAAFREAVAMSFIALIARNLLRQRARSALTMLGIAIGIMTVVALGVIVDGLMNSAGQILDAGNSDFMLGQKGSSDLSFSSISEDEWHAIEQRPDVDRAVGAIIGVNQIGSTPYFITIGLRPEDMPFSGATLIAGRYPAVGTTTEAMIGDKAASTLGLDIGGVLTVGDVTLDVVGIYRTGNLWQDGGAYAPLAVVQHLTGRQGTVTMVYVEIADGQDRDTVAARIEADFPALTAVMSTAEYGEVDQGTQMIDAANMAISLLAVAIGAIGVMNTMVMAVFERTREIGILRAVGWRGRRIFVMIAGEALILSALAAILGAALGAAAAQLVALTALESFFEPYYTLNVFLRALVVAGIVAFVGASYPAYRAIRLQPMEALRHE
jgi:putative ABC transport system permease protein